MKEHFKKKDENKTNINQSKEKLGEVKEEKIMKSEEKRVVVNKELVTKVLGLAENLYNILLEYNLELSDPSIRPFDLRCYCGKETCPHDEDGDVIVSTRNKNSVEIEMNVSGAYLLPGMEYYINGKLAEVDPSEKIIISKKDEDVVVEHLYEAYGIQKFEITKNGLKKVQDTFDCRDRKIRNYLHRSVENELDIIYSKLEQVYQKTKEELEKELKKLKRLKKLEKEFTRRKDE
jgi:hypothetical protein